MITIKLISRSSGKPVSGRKVTVVFSGMTRGTDSGFTDSSGEVDLNVSPGAGEVYVDGSSKHKGHLSGRVTVYV